MKNKRLSAGRTGVGRSRSEIVGGSLKVKVFHGRGGYRITRKGPIAPSMLRAHGISGPKTGTTVYEVRKKAKTYKARRKKK